MSVHARIIPVEGITELPDVSELAREAEIRRENWELLLLNLATALAVVLVSSAWVFIALE